jgi:hypothetical protein
MKLFWHSDTIIRTPEEADYADDDGMLTVVTLLGLQVQGYVTLHNRRESGQDRIMDGEENVQEGEPGPRNKAIMRRTLMLQLFDPIPLFFQFYPLKIKFSNHFHKIPCPNCPSIQNQ